MQLAREALMGVDGILAARTELERVFEYITPGNRAPMVAAMSEVAEEAFWERHGKHLPGFFES
jgi:hypothetical protein